MGVMNIAVVFPQFLVSLAAGPLVAATDDASTTMLAGAAFAFIGAGLVYTLIIPRPGGDVVDRLRLADAEDVVDDTETDI